MKTKKYPVKKAFAAAMALSLASQMSITQAFSGESDIELMSISDVSSFGVDIKLDFPSPGDTFTVTLTPVDGEINGIFSFEAIAASDGKVASGIRRDIPVGTYNLTISAPGYADYTQEGIKISKGFATMLELNNSSRVNTQYNLTGSQRHGIISIGDVAGKGADGEAVQGGDGKVDELDVQLMQQQMDNPNADSVFDLNNDGAVNIADMAYVTMNMGENVTAAPLNIISPESIVPAQGENTKIASGSLDSLTGKADSFVQLAPESDGEISEDNPVEVSLEIAAPEQQEGTQEQPNNEASGIVIKPPAGSENRITAGVITIEDTDGVLHTFDISKGEEIDEGEPALVSLFEAADEENPIKIESDGTVVLNIGRQIAIKRVTIKVTGASTKLVDIAEVEFVNNMQDRIPEPELSVPDNIVLEKVSAGNDPSFKVSWRAQTNVEAYEVVVSANGKEVTMPKTSDTEMTITGFGTDKLATYVQYAVRIRSLSGDWRSPYSSPVTITLTPDDVPPVPEYVEAEGLVEAVKVSWRDMRDTVSYTLEYREKGETDFTAVQDIKSTSYTIVNLKPSTVYEVRVAAVNELGSSAFCALNQAETKAAAMVRMPAYKLINTPSDGELTEHVISVGKGNNNTKGDPKSIVDNSQDTYISTEDFDAAYHYPNGNLAIPSVKLDRKYKIDTVCIAPSASQPYSYTGAALRYTDESGAWQRETASISRRTDKNGNIYYTINTTKPVTSDEFQLCLTTSGGRLITISEMRFYDYDPIEDDIDALYVDTMHLKLADNVTDKTLDELEARLEVADEVSGELHPDHDTLKQEIAYARELLATTALADIVTVDTNVTPRADGHVDFAMTESNNQPLGLVAEAGEQLIVYVGSPNEAEGTNTNLNLIATQNHGEAAKWKADLGQLKVGRNVVEIPNIKTSAEAENGGSIYVAWNGNKGARQYSVRVSGGQKIPVLNVAGLSGSERTDAIKAYMTELEDYADTIQTIHSENHDVAYRDDCIANYTEIVMDNMMFSVPATQVLKGLNGGGAAQLENAISAMEQQVDLFYQHKGFNKEAASDSTNRYPTQRLNIRYHTMFTGAFMYAGGQHIGIEYDSVPGLFGAKPVTYDEKGKKQDGGFTGWGIAHEIGHVINNGKYVHAEVTNNYFSMLATQQERINYDELYNHVTKGTTGTPGLATSLGMYWQLHMFYDNYYDYKTFDKEEDQLKNLFFARVDAYARKPASAPKAEENGVELTLTSSTSDNLIRLASAAAQKNLIPFFEAWGYVPNDETRVYAEQFPEETHKIQYINESAREYRIDGGARMPEGTSVKAEIATPHPGNVINSTDVEISLSNTASDAMLGYEIIRNGKPVAFVTADKTSYTDKITTGNNMVYKYQVIGYDKLLNTTAAEVLEPVKVKHDGTISRDNWTAETNMVSDADVDIKANGDNGYCEDTYESAIGNIIDNDKSTTYTGKSDLIPFITLKLGNTEQVTALKYDGAPADFSIFVSEDNVNWTAAKTVEYDGKGEQKIYFNRPDKADTDGKGYMYIYNAAYVTLYYNGSDTVSVNNIEILGPTSDNVELLEGGIGKLKDDFVYDTNDPENCTIPAGSVVCTGVYKGNPAYNVVKLFDENGKILDGSQIIMAEDPEDGDLGNVSSGIWIYQLTGDKLPSSVTAELYRVDNALTLEGERRVSDTLSVKVPSELPEIEIQSDAPASAAAVSSDGIEIQYKAEALAPNKILSLMSAALKPAEAEEEPKLDGGFVFTNSSDDRSALMQLHLEEETGYTIAFQSDFKISEDDIADIEDVEIEWSDVIENRAAYKYCTYNADEGVLSVYVVAGYDMLEDGVATLGNVTLVPRDEAMPVKDVNLTLVDNSTVTLYDTFAVNTSRKLDGEAHLKAGVETEAAAPQIYTTDSTASAEGSRPAVIADGNDNYLAAIVSREDIEAKAVDVQFVMADKVIDSADNDNGGVIYEELDINGDIYLPHQLSTAISAEDDANYCVYAVKIENDNATQDVYKLLQDNITVKTVG